MKKFFQKLLINFIVKNLFNGITEDDILRIVSREVVFYKGKKLPQEDVERIKNEAERFIKSPLWRYLHDEVRYQANLRMFNKSQTVDDILAGKMALWVLEVIRKKLNVLRQLK